jgi:dTDP-4-dehydrorhamnose reductase
MRILVTGTSGQVGGAIQKALFGRGQILAPGRSELDLSKPASISSALDALQPGLIINPAAYTAVDRAEEEAELAFRVNAEAPSQMARWAAARQVPLIHFSTDYVFSGEGDRPWREDDPCEPLSVYGKSKREGEIAIREAGGVHLILRTSWVYASRGNNFFRTIIRLARERPELRVVADQIGAPTSAQSIAEAVNKLISVGIDEMTTGFAQANGLVHIANLEFTSWHGFATHIVHGLKARNVALQARQVIPIQTKNFPTKALRPLNSRLDVRRLLDLFGVTLPGWQVALSDELDNFVRAEKTVSASKVVREH